MDPMIYTIITHPLKLATYHELQTCYDLDDVYDLMEVIDAHDTTEIVHRKRAELAAKQK